MTTSPASPADRPRIVLAALVLGSILTACGGNGSGGGSPDDAPPGTSDPDAPTDASGSAAAAAAPPATGRLAPDAGRETAPGASPLADPDAPPGTYPGPVSSPESDAGTRPGAPGVPDAPAGSVPAGRVACGPLDEAGRARALALVNAARAAPRRCGDETVAAAPPLAWDSRLERAAAAHSGDMAAHDFFDHTGSDGVTVAGRVTAAGLEWTALGENVAAGQDDARAAVRGWLDGPGHCRNLMNPDYALMGLACAAASDSSWGEYWTQVFSRAVEPDAP